MSKETREIELIIGGQKAAKSLNELQADARKFKKIISSLKPEQEGYNELVEKTKKAYEANQKAIQATRQELGLNFKAEQKMNAELEKTKKQLEESKQKAKELTEALKKSKNESKETVKTLNNELKRTQKEVEDTEKALKQTNKALQKSEKNAERLGNALKNITKAAFWIALIQQVYELAQAFVGLTLQVGEVRKEVARLTGATGSELDLITAKVQGLSKVFKVDYNDVLMSANALSKNLGVSMEEALNKVQVGLQKSGKNGGEFLEQIKEYSSALADSGLTEDEIISIVATQAESGVFNDFGIDAIKEFTIKLTTESDKTLKRLKQIEKATGQTFGAELVKNLETGKATTGDALRIITGELAKLPPEANVTKQALSELFGSKGEDNSARYIQSLKNTKSNVNELLDSKSKRVQIENQEIESAEALALAQSELNKEIEGSASGFQILINKGLTKTFKFITQLIERGDAVSDTFRTFFAEVKDLGDELGLFSDSGDTATFMVKALNAVLIAILTPIRAQIKIAKLLAVGLKGLYNRFESVRTIVDATVAGFKAVAGAGEDVLNFFDRAITSDEELAKRAKRKEAKIKESTDELQKIRDEAEKKKSESDKKSTEKEKKATITREKQISQAYRDELKKRAENSEKAQREITAKKIELIEDDTKRLIAKIKEQVRIEKAENAKRQSAGEITENQRVELDSLVDKNAEKGLKDLQNSRLQIEKTAQAELQVLRAKNDRERVEAELNLLRLKNEEELSNVNKTESEKQLIREQFAQNEKDKLAQVRIDELEAEKNFEIEKAKLRVQEASLNVDSANASGDESAISSANQDKTNAELGVLRLENELKNQILEEQFTAELISKEEFENQKFLIAENARLQEAEADAKAKQEEIDRAKKLEEQKQQIQKATLEATSGLISAGIDLLSQDEKARKKNAAILKTASIGQVVINTQQEISGYLAHPVNGKTFGIAGGIKVAAALIRAASSIAKIKAQKFEFGGLLSGPSHRQGGIRGTGQFGNIEVEGGEYVTNKRATYNNLPVLEAINTYGDKINFGKLLTFETGGQLPNTTPSNSVINNILPDNSGVLNQLVQENKALREDMASWQRNFKVYLPYNNIEEAGAKKAEILDY